MLHQPRTPERTLLKPAAVTSLVLVFALAGGFVGAVAAAGDDGTIEKCTVIDSPGTYTLANDVTNTTATTCIEVTSSDVVINGDGHTITGDFNNGTIAVLVDALAISNVTVRNLVVNDSKTGIKMINVSDGAVTGITATNVGHGIYHLHVDDVTVRDVHATGFTGAGIALADVNNATITNVTAKNGDIGLFSLDLVNGTVVDVTLSDVNDGVEMGGIDTISRDVTIRRVTVESVRFDAFVIDGQNVTLTDAYVNNGGDGLELDVSNFTGRNLTVINGTGMDIAGDHVTLDDVTRLNGSDDPVEFESVDNATVTDLYIDGVGSESGHTDSGLVLDVTDSTFANVTVRDATIHGILINSADNVTLTDIVTADNAEYGIYVDDFDPTNLTIQDGTSVRNGDGAFSTITSDDVNTVTDLRISDRVTVSFLAEDSGFSTDAVAGPSGFAAYQYVDVTTEDSGYVNFTEIEYDDTAFELFEEEALEVWRHDGAVWATDSTATLDTTANAVAVKVTSTSTLALVGDVPDSQIAVCGVIDQSGTYTIAADLSGSGSCLTVTSDDVTIDGMGHTITGSNVWGGGTGIYVDGTGGELTNVTIENLTVRDWGGVGLKYENATGTIADVTAVHNWAVSENGLNEDGIGIQVTDSRNVTIHDVTARESAKDGIYIEDSVNVTVRDVAVFDNDGGGLSLETVSNSSVTNVYAERNGDPCCSGRDGVSIKGTNLTISNVTSVDSLQSGVEIDASSSTVTDIISRNSSDKGIVLGGFNTPSTLVASDLLSINNSWDGIEIDVNDAVLSNLTTIGNGGNGLYIQDSATNVTLVDVTVTGNEFSGIFVVGNDVTLANATATGNGDAEFTEYPEFQHGDFGDSPTPMTVTNLTLGPDLVVSGEVRLVSLNPNESAPLNEFGTVPVTEFDVETVSGDGVGYANVSLAYEESAFELFDESDLQFSQYDESAGHWLDIFNSPNTMANTISGNVTETATVGLFGDLPDNQFATCGEAFGGMNPKYTLVADIVANGSSDLTATGACLGIKQGAATIEGNGHTITGPGTPGSVGVFLNGSAVNMFGSSSVSNLTVTDFGSGVVTVDSDEAELMNVTVRDTETIFNATSSPNFNVTDLDVSPAATLSFEVLGNELVISGLNETPPDGYDGDVAVESLNVSLSNALDLTVSYDASGLPVNESSLTLAGYDGTSWTGATGQTLDTDANVVNGTLPSDSTIIALVADNESVPPIADAGSDVTVDEGVPVSFDATASTDNFAIAGYAWDFGDGANATGATPTHTYTQSGTYTVNLTVTDAAGNNATDSITVTVRAESSGRGGGGGGDDDGDQGQDQDGRLSVELMNGEASLDVGGDILSLAIDFGDDTSSTASVEGFDELPEGVPPIPGTTGITFVDVTVPPSLSDSAATMQLTLDADTLGDVDPADLVIYHYHDGEWTALDTTLISTTDGEIVIKATTPGFSLFAVGPAPQQTTPDDEPTTPDDTTPDDETATPGPDDDETPGPGTDDGEPNDDPGSFSGVTILVVLAIAAAVAIALFVIARRRS